MKTRFRSAILATVIGLLPVSLARSEQALSEVARSRLERQVRHELIMLPFYSVFDNLVFAVDGDQVMDGSVRRQLAVLRRQMLGG